MSEFLGILRYKYNSKSKLLKIWCNHPKSWRRCLFFRVMHPKDAEGIANSVDPDQTAPLGAVWSGSALFAQACLSENLETLRYSPGSSFFSFCLRELQWKFQSEGMQNYFEPRHDKTNKVTVRPAKTQISLGIHQVWSESSLCTQWVAKDPSFLHADSEDSDQTGLIWAFAGRTLVLSVLSCRGLFNVIPANDINKACLDTRIFNPASDQFRDLVLVKNSSRTCYQ